MPEGPEIRRAADKLEQAIVGQPLRAVEFAFARLKSFEEELAASRVRAIETRGKALLTHFANGLSVYSHNQLYGRWQVVKAGALPKTTRSLRFAVRGTSHDILLYSNLDSEAGKMPAQVGGSTREFSEKVTVWASFDGGRTWPVKRLVHDGPGAYSTLAVGRSGTPRDRKSVV